MVDVAIITMKTEEFRAVFRRFPDKLDPPKPGLRARYQFRKCPLPSGDYYSLAIIRCSRQGLTEAQQVTNDVIQELKPRCIIVVGIGGAAPSEDLFLGDVVLATLVHDFSLGAETNEGWQPALFSYPVTKTIGRLIANLAGYEEELGNWHSDEVIGKPRPKTPEIKLEGWTGNSKWDSKIKKTIERHGNKSRPDFVDSPIASSDDLLKNYEKLEERLAVDRRILMTEMEAAGVAKACEQFQGGNIPFMVIRSVSDIVGLPRDSAWTDYACEVAASFVKAFLELGLLEENSPVEIKVSKTNSDRIVNTLKSVEGPIPIEVLAEACNLKTEELEYELQNHLATSVLSKTQAGIALGTKYEEKSSSISDINDFKQRVLTHLLTFIQLNSSDLKGIRQTRNASQLFSQLDSYQRRILAPRVFDVLDKPLKALGDKNLVLATANSCIEAVRHTNRTREEKECEARVRICGLSWVYQRIDQLHKAKIEAGLSLKS